MPRKRIKCHGEQDSPFYKLRSKAKLANLLFLDVDKLKHLADSEDLYFDFRKKKRSGGFRPISAPRADLKIVQKRIADLLQRITPPDYLFAPVSGRSYVDNATRHLGANSVRSLDIKDFFRVAPQTKSYGSFESEWVAPRTLRYSFVALSQGMSRCHRAARAVRF